MRPQFRASHDSVQCQCSGMDDIYLGMWIKDYFSVCACVPVCLQLYAWPLLQTLFSEVLSKGEWLRVWDNVVSHHPGYLLLMVVAYLITARHTLLKCSQKEDLKVQCVGVIGCRDYILSQSDLQEHFLVAGTNYTVPGYISYAILI